MPTEASDRFRRSPLPAVASLAHHSQGSTTSKYFFLFSREGYGHPSPHPSGLRGCAPSNPTRKVATTRLRPVQGLPRACSIALILPLLFNRCAQAAHAPDSTEPFFCQQRPAIASGAHHRQQLLPVLTVANDRPACQRMLLIQLSRSLAI